MKTFVVNSAILTPGTDPRACALGSPQRLEQAGVENVKLKNCYCCGPQDRVVFIVEAESQDAALNAFFKINVPVASILEAEEMNPTE